MKHIRLLGLIDKWKTKGFLDSEGWRLSFKNLNERFELLQNRFLAIAMSFGKDELRFIPNLLLAVTLLKSFMN